MIKTIFSILLLFITFANAQESVHGEGEEMSEKRHSIAILISHTQIGEAVEGEGKKIIGTLLGNRL